MGRKEFFFQFTCFTCEIFVFSVYNVLPWSVVSVFLSQTKVYQEHLKQTNKKNVQIIINNSQVTWLVIQRSCATDWEQSSLSHTRQHKHGCVAMPLAMPLAMHCTSTIANRMHDVHFALVLLGKNQIFVNFHSNPQWWIKILISYSLTQYRLIHIQTYKTTWQNKGWEPRQFFDSSSCLQHHPQQIGGIFRTTVAQYIIAGCGENDGWFLPSSNYTYHQATVFTLSMIVQTQTMRQQLRRKRDSNQ